MAKPVKPVSTDLEQFLGDQQTAGVRGFVVGEDHHGTVLPEELAARMKRFKARGVTTLYVEHIPSDRNDVLQAALTGDEKAQKKIRADLEFGFGEKSEMAQSRYDMMMAAHAAGINALELDGHTQSRWGRSWLSNSIPAEPRIILRKGCSQ